MVRAQKRPLHTPSHPHIRGLIGRRVFGRGERATTAALLRPAMYCTARRGKIEISCARAGAKSCGPLISRSRGGALGARRVLSSRCASFWCGSRLARLFSARACEERAGAPLRSFLSASLLVSRAVLRGENPAGGARARGRSCKLKLKPPGLCRASPRYAEES